MRNRWFIAAIVVGVAAIVIAAVAMRLSDNGSSKPSAAEWASSVCTDLGTWKTSISSLASGGATLNPSTLKGKIDTAQTATSTLVSELKALGPPDVESGAELQQTLQSNADKLQASFDSLKTAAQQAVQAGSPKAVAQALVALGPQYQALLDDLSSTVNDLQNANVAASAKSELQAAFAGAQSCQDLQGNG